jgi:hypothetical protein
MTYPLPKPVHLDPREEVEVKGGITHIYLEQTEAVAS